MCSQLNYGNSIITFFRDLRGRAVNAAVNELYMNYERGQGGAVIARAAPEKIGRTFQIAFSYEIWCFPASLGM